MTWVDLLGQVVFGVGSLVALAYLYRNSDAFSDGNVGCDDER